MFKSPLPSKFDKIKLHNCLFFKIKIDNCQVVTPIQMLASILARFFECYLMCLMIFPKIA